MKDGICHLPGRLITNCWVIFRAPRENIISHCDSMLSGQSKREISGGRGG